MIIVRPNARPDRGDQIERVATELTLHRFNGGRSDPRAGAAPAERSIMIAKLVIVVALIVVVAWLVGGLLRDARTQRRR